MEIKTTSEIKKIRESHRMKSIHNKLECLCGEKFSSVYRMAEHIALFENKWVAVDDLTDEIKKANIEIKGLMDKMRVISPVANHWIDQFYKMLMSNIKK